MKKRESLILGILLLAIFSLSLISATIDITLTKDSYYQAETLQATITGSFVEGLDPANIGIYEKDSSHKLPTESNLVRTDENTYLYYATLPDTVGNYYVLIENTKHLEITTESDTPILKNFTITSTNNSYLSINPGFIYTSQDFEVTIKAYNKNQPVVVECAATGTKESFNLGYASSKTISFPIDRIKQKTETLIKVNSYTIPAIISPKITNPDTNTTEIKDNLKNMIVLSPMEINVTIAENVDYHFQVLIVNKDRFPTDINLTSWIKEIKVSPILLDNFDDEAVINITITTSTNLKSNITLISPEGRMIIPINVKTTKNLSEVNLNDTTVLNRAQTCAEFNGNKCTGKETCDGSQIYASDGSCCIGKCSVPSSSNAWVWGLVILVILAIGGYFLYQRSNSQSGQSIKDIFKKRSDDYNKKINPKADAPKEVRGNLSNI
jgi:hypothetical protein